MASPDYEDDYDELYYDDESLFFIDDTPLNEVVRPALPPFMSLSPSHFLPVPFPLSPNI